MSFSSETKKELCRLTNKKEQDDLAEGYGMLLFSRCLTMSPRTVKFENTDVARLIAEYAAQLGGIIPEMRTKFHSRLHSGECTFFSIPGEDQRKTLLSVFGHDSGCTLINRAIAGRAPAAFLRGAFLVCGNMTDPQKEYHLELIAGSRSLAEDLSDFISEAARGLDFQPSVSERNSSSLLYIKDSSRIEDFLTYIGASKASMELMQVKMYKEVMNDINRRTNFETANMDRTMSASAKQVLAIALINDTIGFSKLTPELRELCELRLENPDMSLKGLSEKLGISRSGVNHRLRKIMQIAEDCSDSESIKELIT